MRRWVMAGCLLAAFCGSAAADNERQNWASLNQVAAGTEIRVVLSNGKTLRGFLQSTSGEGLVINATTSQEKVARAEVKRVQRKRPGHRGRNTLIGLGIGTAGGLVTGAALDSKTNDDWFPNAGKAVFTPIGALLGTVIGVAIPTGGWREVYRAP